MQILTGDEMRRAVTRLAMQAVECCKGTDFVLIGIRTRGVILARRMQREIARLEGVQVPLGILDISLYRDDLLDGCDAVFKGSEIGFDLDGRTVVLCDDVLHTGRSAVAGIETLFRLGRPAKIELLVLVDRGGRELPVRADFVGKNVPTAREEYINVRLKELGHGEDSLTITRRDNAAS